MSANHRLGIQTALIAAVCLILAACGSTPVARGGSRLNPVNWLTPYKTDIVQGNVVTSEQVGLLQPGLAKAQVRDILGTPLLASVFHADRWDYVFTLKRQAMAAQSRRLTVFFKGDVLARFEGDTMPSEAEFVASLDSKQKLGAVPVLELTPEQLLAVDKKTVTEVAAVPAPAPAATVAKTYPPLEGLAQ
jgi:outer membrane protein assembly factor BamE